ncbi:MAG: hypothetical protein WDN46_21160 [Methylocella sp.]
METKSLCPPSSASRVLACVGLALGLGIMLAPAAFAQQEASGKPKPSFATPLPPVRPPEFDGNRATVDTPAPPALSSPAAATPGSAANAAAPANLLPSASRERMHACGLEWQKMKLSGAAKNKTWRDFAQVCLAE